jgi:hypothetical protein
LTQKIIPDKFGWHFLEISGYILKLENGSLFLWAGEFSTYNEASDPFPSGEFSGIKALAPVKPAP